MISVTQIRKALEGKELEEQVDAIVDLLIPEDVLEINL